MGNQKPSQDGTKGKDATMAGLTQLERHLRCYADDGESCETWKPLHKEVMALHDFADALGEEVSLGLYLLDRLKKKTTRTFEDAKTLYESYIAWHERSLLVLRAIEQSEKKEFPVEGSTEFRAAFTEISSIVTKIKGRIDALNEFIAGEGIPAEDFLARLRRTVQKG